MHTRCPARPPVPANGWLSPRHTAPVLLETAFPTDIGRSCFLFSPPGSAAPRPLEDSSADALPSHIPSPVHTLPARIPCPLIVAAAFPPETNPEEDRRHSDKPSPGYTPRRRSSSVWHTGDIPRPFLYPWVILSLSDVPFQAEPARTDHPARPRLPTTGLHRRYPEEHPSPLKTTYPADIAPEHTSRGLQRSGSPAQPGYSPLSNSASPGCRTPGHFLASPLSRNIVGPSSD